MKPKIIVILLLILSFNLLNAHPHIFIDYTITKSKNSNIQIQWTLDPIESEKMLYYFDDNSDGELNYNEGNTLFNEGFKSLEDYNYFLTLKINNDILPIKEINDFSVEVEKDNRLTYTFFIDVPKLLDDDKLSVSHFDTSYFISFAEPDVKSVLLEGDLYSIIKKNRDNPIYYDPMAGRTVVLNTSKKQPGWLKAYPTEIIISKKPFLDSFQQYDITVKEKVLQLQKLFYYKLSGYLSSIKKGNKPSAILFIALFAFIYGVIHALGPGHRKIVISSYLLTSKKATYLKGLSLSMLSALIHSGTSVIIILVLKYIILKIGDNLINQITFSLENIGYIALLILGLFLLISKLIKKRKRGLKKRESEISISLIILSSLIPCPGAMTIMLFSISLNIISAGILSVFAMSLGIGSTLTLISILTVKGKHLISGLKQSRFRVIQLIIEWAALIILICFALFMLMSQLRA